jgi:hypothetical protein
MDGKCDLANIENLDVFPSSVVFDSLNKALENKEVRDECLAMAKTVFAIEIQNEKGIKDRWYIDCRQSGKVSKSATPKPDGK